MTINRSCFLVLIVLLGIIPSADGQEGGVSPIYYRNLYPTIQPFISYTMEGIHKGDPSFSVHSGLSNYYRYDNHYWHDSWTLLIDGESYQVAGEWKGPLPWGGGWGVTLPIGLHFSGFFDPLIQGFHHLFGFPNGGRELNADNQASLFWNSPSFTHQDRRVHLGLHGVTLTASTPILYSKGQYQLQGSIKIPPYEGYFPITNSGWDGELLGIAAYRLPSWQITLNGGLQYLTKPKGLDINFRPWSFIYGFSAAYTLPSKESYFIGQLQGQSSPYFSGHSRLDNHSSYVVFGYRRVFTNSFVLDVSFAEEFLTYGATDISGNFSLKIPLGW